MLAAAAAWNTMAAEMRFAAASYGSVVSELTSESWFGPSSMSMVAAAAPYLGWLSTTATQAEPAGSRRDRLRGRVCHDGAPGGRRGQPR